jgi:plastocyanin
MHRSTARCASVLLGAALVLAACGGAPSGTDGTPSPTEEPTATATATMDHDMPTATETESSEPTEAAENGDVEVVVGMSSFSPTTLTIPAGTEVAFVNSSSLPHTVTHGTSGRAVEDPAFDRPVDAGATVRITFDDPGTFDVTCRIHPTMQMTVIVEG